MMTKTEYAKRIGVSKQYVNKLLKQGKIHATISGEIDETKADRELSRNLAPVKVKIPQIDEKSAYKNSKTIDLDDPDISYIEAHTALEVVRCKMAQLELDLKENKLLWAEEVKKELFTANRIIRDSILSIQQRICPSLPCSPEVRFAVEQAMTIEINKILQKLSDDLGRMNHDDAQSLP